MAPGVAVTGEPALVERILRFVSSTDDATDVSHSTPMQTIASVCRVVPGLGRRLGPANDAFWRDMVLGHFDFTVDSRVHNVKDWDVEAPWSIDGFEDDVGDDPALAHWHRHPWSGPLDEWFRDFPDLDRPCYVLWHGLQYWPALKTFFRPAAYGFLRLLQQDREATMWPADEDAYSLFRDLLLLRHFRSTEQRQFLSGDYPAAPCLLGRLPAKILGEGYAMLKFCDFAPHYWQIVYWRVKGWNPVKRTWSGLVASEPPVVCECDDTYACGVCRNDDEYRFPKARGTQGQLFSDLRCVVYDAFADWRRVELYEEAEFPPIYHIGRTKASGRWLGFVSGLDPCE